MPTIIPEEDLPPIVPFSFWVTVAFTLNYIIGSGFLTLPWAFMETGTAIGIASLVIIGFFSILSVLFILETIERGKVIDSKEHKSLELISISNPYQQVSLDQSSHQNDDDEEIQGIQFNQIGAYNPISVTDDDLKEPESYHQSEVINQTPGNPRKLEITELCDIFLGSNGRIIYTIIITIYMYGTLWAYSTVFANSFATYLPIGQYSYFIYLIIFALMVVPISLLEFSEQVEVQVSLSIFRVLMVLAMVCTIIMAYSSGKDEFQIETENTSNLHTDTFTKVDFSKLHLLLPIAAYAYIFHHSVPSLAEPVSDSKSLVSLFSTALVISMILYIAIGAIISGYFGKETNISSNLNWKSYVGTGIDNAHIPMYAKIFAFFIVLFPAIDVASAFPLNAYTLGNNLMSSYYGKDMYRFSHSKWKFKFFRALAAIPPIFGALIESNLGHITDYTGLTGFGLAFIIPPLLSYYSKQKLRGMKLNPYTIHSSRFTSFPFQVLLFCSGVGLLLYVGICLLIFES